jgi:threonylcarbamoyladenosine tRNA methylthiotransferase MtaB
MAAKYLLSTLGCKVNQYESQQIRDVVESLGFTAVLPGETPDIAVVNTCAVTADATRKSRCAVRRIPRDEGTDIFVVGCGASADADRLRKLHGVAAVLGHDADICAELRRLLQARLSYPSEGPAAGIATVPQTHGDAREPGENNGWIKPGSASAGQEHPAGRKSDGAHATSPAQPARTPVSPQGIISTPLHVVKTPEALIGRIDSFAGHQRAFLKVQDGCDAHCTYCIIPQLRPALRSKPIDAAVAEARALVQAGHKEVVLTGIFLGAYGRTTAVRKRFRGGRPPLADLVEAIATIEGLHRLRLSSLEPGDVEGDLLEVLATRPACVPHLHLPLQAGSPDNLRRMNRQYRADEFVAMIDRVLAALDEPAISTDIMVGFPGETERDFELTMQVARYARFCKIHAFPFSAREGTAAARWSKDFVPHAIVRKRMRELADLERELSIAYRTRLVGRRERVIVEPGAKVLAGDSQNVLHHGRCDRYCMIDFESCEELRAGDLAHVRIDRITPDRTHATLLWPRSRSTPLSQFNAGGSPASRS